MVGLLLIDRQASWAGLGSVPWSLHGFSRASVSEVLTAGPGLFHCIRGLALRGKVVQRRHARKGSSVPLCDYKTVSSLLVVRQQKGRQSSGCRSRGQCHYLSFFCLFGAGGQLGDSKGCCRILSLCGGKDRHAPGRSLSAISGQVTRKKLYQPC